MYASGVPKVQLQQQFDSTPWDTNSCLWNNVSRKYHEDIAFSLDALYMKIDMNQALNVQKTTACFMLVGDLRILCCWHFVDNICRFEII